MANEQLDLILRKTLEDFKVSRGEKRILKNLLREFDPDSRQQALIRHRIFEIAREEMLGPQAQGVIDWLEDMVKILDADSAQTGNEPQEHEIFFSPGDSCVRAIARLLERARQSVDICVFTITDDRITDAILDARNRLAVRIISDNDKAEDRGSDIERLARAGITVLVDDSEHHMHHKFAIFDKRTTLTGSYNWTRSAAQHNQENILVTHDTKIARTFQQEFDRLWQELQ